jgi:hypothetical protein
MASVLAFNNLTAVNPSVTVSTAQFANGSGTYTENGYDTNGISTGDFCRHYVRKAINRSGSFSVYGNLVSTLRSTGGLGGTITLKLGLVTIATFTGVLIPKYDEDAMITRVEIRGDAAVT